MLNYGIKNGIISGRYSGITANASPNASAPQIAFPTTLTALLMSWVIFCIDSSSPEYSYKIRTISIL